MLDRSNDQITALTPSDGAACDLHGRAWTGVPVATNEDGESAVLQYVHPDWAKVTPAQISAFQAEKTCCECGDPTDELPDWVANRILMACPNIVLEEASRWEGICAPCAHKKVCPHCGDKDEEDEDGNLWSTHPYCH